VQIGAAAGKVMLPVQLTVVLVDAVQVPVAGALTEPLPEIVIGTVMSCVLPPGPLKGAGVALARLKASTPVPAGLGSPTKLVKLVQLGNKIAGLVMTGVTPGALMEQVKLVLTVGRTQVAPKGAGVGALKPKLMAGADTNVAVAVPETGPVVQPDGRLPKLALLLDCTLPSAPTPPERRGLSPTKPLMRHWPFKPLPKPEISTEPRPRVTTGAKFALAR
jgi:hypothetical protein